MSVGTAVRLLTSARPRQFAAFVTLPGEPEVRVRFHRSDWSDQWRCDTCGSHRFATCPHETAALERHRQQTTPDRPPTGDPA